MDAFRKCYAANCLSFKEFKKVLQMFLEFLILHKRQILIGNFVELFIVR